MSYPKKTANIMFSLLHRVRGGFPLNYGREAVCELINKPEKEHSADNYRENFFGRKKRNAFIEIM